MQLLAFAQAVVLLTTPQYLPRTSGPRRRPRATSRPYPASSHIATASSSSSSSSSEPPARPALRKPPVRPHPSPDPSHDVSAVATGETHQLAHKLAVGEVRVEEAVHIQSPHTLEVKASGTFFIAPEPDILPAMEGVEDGDSCDDDIVVGQWTMSQRHRLEGDNAGAVKGRGAAKGAAKRGHGRRDDRGKVSASAEADTIVDAMWHIFSGENVQVGDRWQSGDSEADVGIGVDELLRLKGREVESANQMLARELYLRCVKICPSNGKGWQDLSKVEARLFGGLKYSAAVLRRALEANPSNAYLWQSLGFLSYRMDKYDEARAYFRDGISADAQHSPLYSTWGRMEGILGNVAVARQLFREGAVIEPACARLLSTWALMELKLGNLVSAKELLQRGLKVEPDNAFIWQILGSMAVDEVRFDQARVCFKRALTEDPENVVVLDHWARLEARLGNCNAARDLFKRGVNSNSKDVRILQGWSLLELHRGNLSQARELTRRAVEIEPSDSILWDQFAKIEIEIGHIARARALFKRASEVNPKDWRVWDNWSAMEHSEGNAEEAAFLLNKSFGVRFNAQGEFNVFANHISEDLPVGDPEIPSIPGF